MIKVISKVSFAAAIGVGIASSFIMPADSFGFTNLVNDRELVLKVAIGFLVIGAIVEFFNGHKEDAR